ncbi:hypothetical protein [Herbiconiux liangxiaofengii]|uniref:hypothetical protein n=1 Tax=Herbiconiux liangxiaofengii TaxID=3342795 RepID=UPI0035BA5945
MQHRQSSPRIPVPASLAAAPFSVREGTRAGLGRQRLLGRDLHRPFAGARVTPGDPTLSLQQLCAAYQARSPTSHFFSHVTAARLWDAPLPLAAEGEAHVHVSCNRPGAVPRARGVVGHLLADPQLRVTGLRGLRLCDPATTWCQLESLLDFGDLVAVGDFFVLERERMGTHSGPERRALVPIGELRRRAEERSGPGSRVLRRAAAAVRVGAESRRESLLRLLIVGHGLPEPLLNQNVFDADGQWLGRADMLYPAQNVIVEYNGDLHRTDLHQFEHDVVRIESFRRAGYSVVEVRSRGLTSQRHQTLERVSHALALPLRPAVASQELVLKPP